MLEITKSAVTNLKKYMALNRNSSALRVALMEGGSFGPALGLAMDVAGAGDEIFQQDELKFVVDKDLLGDCGEIKVDFVEVAIPDCDSERGGGFTITSARPLGDDEYCL